MREVCRMHLPDTESSEHKDAIIHRIYIGGEEYFENDIFQEVEAQKHPQGITPRFNFYKPTSFPCPGFDLFRRTIKNETEGDVEIEEEKIAFIPYSRIHLITFKDESHNPEKNLVILDVGD